MENEGARFTTRRPASTPSVPRDVRVFTSITRLEVSQFAFQRIQISNADSKSLTLGLPSPPHEGFVVKNLRPCKTMRAEAHTRTCFVKNTPHFMSKSACLHPTPLVALAVG
jgi:hypothetical protein